MRNRTWEDPPYLGADEVHLWWGRVGLSGDPEGDSESLLDSAERARADRFHRAVHRRRFRVRRRALRKLLGAYLDEDPAALRFGEGPHGKPELAERDGEARLSFNLSHSGDSFVIAVRRGRRVGVDVEYHRPGLELDRMARQVFSRTELAAWEELEESSRPAAFYRLWTRKEALLKATGEGLGRDPRTLDVGIAPEPPVLGGEFEGWGIEDLAPPANGDEPVAACLVAERAPWARVDLVAR